MELYAYAVVVCIQKVRFPYYVRTQHQQAVANAEYRIECWNFAQLDYYKNLCASLPNHLIFVGALDPNDADYNQMINGGSLDAGSGGSDDVRNGIDGKDFNPENPIRSVYIATTF